MNIRPRWGVRNRRKIFIEEEVAESVVVEVAVLVVEAVVAAVVVEGSEEYRTFATFRE